MVQGISRFSSAVTLFVIFMFVFSTGASAREEMSRTEEHNISPAGIQNIRLRDFIFTDLTYSGEDDRDSLSVTFKRTVKTDDEEEFEEILSELYLDISTSGNTITIRLRHPKKFKLFSSWKHLKGKKWRVIMDVKGPGEIDLDIDAGFSEVRTADTAGNLKFDTSFSKTVCRNHQGMLITDHDFGEFRAEELDGGFTVDSDFCDVTLRLAHLSENSRIDLDFGSVDINLPGNTGAEFHINKSFGDVDFQTDGSLSYEGEKGSRRILNEGGIRVDLDVNFGDINVMDNRPEYTGADEPSESRDRQTRKRDKAPTPKPVFKEGKVASITVRGTNLLSREEVKQIIDIREDGYYKHDEISEAVNRLKDENRFISSASFRIDTDGNLFVRIYEVEPYDLDFDFGGSFSRIAGVGLGPRLTIKSAIGPLSELTGGTQYHWANKEWTYNVRGEKHLFDKNRLVLGATYRSDYESGMEWAIPAYDASLNAFFLGIETNNLYRVEGGTGYISQSVSDFFTVKAEYFEEKFSSLKKHTNWSLFNHRHIKEDNPLLSPDSEGRLAGMRYSARLQNISSGTHTMLYLEAEKTFEDRGDTLPAYTRFFGQFACDQRLPYSHILKLRVAGGYSGDVLPDQKAFRLGGLNTLRGFAFGDVPEPPTGSDGFGYHGGGSRMFLVNLDYFNYGFDDGDLRLIFFGDAGSVWFEGEDTDLKDLKRDLGIGIAFDDDFFGLADIGKDKYEDGFRINLAVPVGNVAHNSHWTVNFVRAY